MSSHPYVTQQNTPLADDTTLMSTTDLQSYITCLLYTSLFFRHTDKFIRCQSGNGCYHIANLSTDVMKNAPDNSKSIERCCGKIPAT